MEPDTVPNPQQVEIPLQYWRPERQATPAVILVFASVISAAFSAVGVFILGFVVGGSFLSQFKGEAMRQSQQYAGTAYAAGLITLAGLAIFRAVQTIRSRRLPLSERRRMRTFIAIGLLFGSAISCLLLSLFWVLAVFAD